MIIEHDMRFLDINLLDESTWNPNEMDGKSFERLVKEISTSGFIAAIQVVAVEGGRYTIIGGAHRFKAAKKLGYEELPCVILTDAQFKNKDLQKFLTVRLNMLSGDLDPEKFRVLYEEMSDKYGADSLEDLFGFTDEDQWNAITKSLKNELKDAGFTEKQIDDALDEAGDDKSIENLSRILNGIFSNNADTLNTKGYMLFDFEGTKMFFIDAGKELFKFFDELQINEKPSDLESKLAELLSKCEEAYV